MNNKFIEYMKEGTNRFDIQLSEMQMEQFYDLYLDLVETNKVMNLTAITELKDVVFKHFIDSLAIKEVINDIDSNNYSVIDVGTGAGFPGIPLSIAYPNLKLVLLDSLAKRVNFINNVSDKLNLKNITAIHGRAEDFAHNGEYREKFDIVVSRAVANLSTLSEYCLPFIHINGRFIPYKSGSVDDEIAKAEIALQRLGAENKGIHRFSLPYDESKRTFIVINKISKTPIKFPRKSGTPSKNPL